MPSSAARLAGGTNGGRAGLGLHDLIICCNRYFVNDAKCGPEKQAAGPASASPAGASRCHLHMALKRKALRSESDFDEQVQSQPSAQLSQQPLSHLQSGQPSQQPLSLQQPLVQVAAAGVGRGEREHTGAQDECGGQENNALVNMMRLTFWLMIGTSGFRA